MKKRTKWVIAPIAAGAAVLAGPEPGLGKITRNTIDPTGFLRAGGRSARGAALVTCTKGERVKVTVTFQQGEVVGLGHARGRCTGEPEPARYEVEVRALDGARFQPGPADACALAVNTDGGKPVDARVWCRAEDIELLEPEG
jgi:hypothetical protein